MSENITQNAIVIGGGFYGAAIAIYLAKERGFKDVLLLEQENALLTRASYNNQARVHNGYHYPRSFTTAYRSRVNLPKFVKDWPNAVKRDFVKLYAIARRNSKVTANQFERFCREIGAKIQIANPALHSLFEPRLIEKVFMVEEYAFNSAILASWAEKELIESGVKVRLNTKVKAISRGENSTLRILLKSKESGVEEMLSSRYVFNCTYSGLNQFAGDFLGTTIELKQEITEMALIKAPTVLDGLGVTLMDGPFFSMMPFPAKGLHTLSHVRYTPHAYWKDEIGVDPYAKLENYNRETRYEWMARDVARYMPAILKSRYVESLFEVKTVLIKNEGDDGRPILFEKHTDLPGCYSVLGGKIDNIYDVLEKFCAEDFDIGN